MSKKFQSIRRILGVLGLTLQFFTFAAAQEMHVELKIDGKRPNEVRVTGRFETARPANESHVLAFAESMAGVSLSAQRISSPSARDKAGKELLLVTSPRCCIATGSINSFSYTVDLTSTKNIRADAHSSWIRDRNGVLMLGDLLPQEFLPSGNNRAAEIRLDLPEGWKTFSTAKISPPDKLEVDDIDSAVVFVGKDWDYVGMEHRGSYFKILTNGEFQFERYEPGIIGGAIIQEYFGRFGGLRAEGYLIAIFRPIASVGEWEADTRGRTALIATTGTPFKSQSLQQLDEQMRHELFHFWIPNGVALRGRYDWFYEGFALYSSLRLAVDSNTIRFDDMLGTLGAAFQGSEELAARRGLIELSKRRFSGFERQMYAKGLWFAFLCDLALNISSNGKRNTDHVVKELYQKHPLGSPVVDGNDAVLKLLNSYPELRPLVDQYVTSNRGDEQKALINSMALLENAGLSLTTVAGRTKLEVKAKLSSRQKAILDKLGYNSWRKLVKDSK
ncbi:MAG TPA: hypothetical protein PKA82_06560 [Pyrinomonadaceae bacterium]|nr:hypothetical protein [Pyrinomonadaceae bacterium]